MDHGLIVVLVPINEALKLDFSLKKLQYSFINSYWQVEALKLLNFSIKKCLTPPIEPLPKVMNKKIKMREPERMRIPEELLILLITVAQWQLVR